MPPCCDFIGEARAKSRENREKRRNKPQSWIVLKSAVGIAVAMLAYTGYVYIGRFCVPIIQQKSSPSRGTGIALLVVFCILYLWILWAYLVVLITPPGFARDFISTSSQPTPPPPVFPLDDASIRQATIDPEKAQDVRQARTSVATSHTSNTVGGPAYEDIPPIIQHSDDPAASQNERGSIHQTPGALKPYIPGPPPIAVLEPVHRYCSRDGFLRPYRAHHCRMCGTCVLKFDHHCPWIGQCVGARNHKYFFNFNESSVVFTAYTFGTLLGFNVHGDIDPQKIVVIALTALFFIFTASLAVAHCRLICLGQSTVEGVMISNLKERVKSASVRDMMYRDEKDIIPECLRNMSSLLAPNAMLTLFKSEWGDPDTEGNLWWLGSVRANWEDTMGTSVVGWILPVGRPLADGLSYKPNWRFHKDGRWKRRAQWGPPPS